MTDLIITGKFFGVDAYFNLQVDSGSAAALRSDLRNAYHPELGRLGSGGLSIIGEGRAIPSNFGIAALYYKGREALVSHFAYWGSRPETASHLLRLAETLTPSELWTAIRKAERKLGRKLHLEGITPTSIFGFLVEGDQGGPGLDTKMAHRIKVFHNNPHLCRLLFDSLNALMADLTGNAPVEYKEGVLKEMEDAPWDS